MTAVLVGASISDGARAGAARAHPVRNGAIAFYAYTKIYAIRPDGTDLHVLVPTRKRNCAVPPGRTGSCLVRSFAWSPDGRRLGFLHGPSTVNGPGAPGIDDSSLYGVTDDGLHERRIPGCGRPWPSCHDFSWSPDSSRVVVSRPDGVFVLGTADHSIRRLTRSRKDAAPTWSPDGRSIAFARGSFGRASVFVIAAEGGAATRVPAATSSAAGCIWSPDSLSLLCQRGGRVVRARIAGRDEVEELGSLPGGTMTGLSPDGARVAYVRYRLVRRGDRPPHSTYSTEVWTMTLSGRRRWRVYAGPPGIVDGPVRAVWSPKGARVAFAADAIYLVGADGSHLRRLSTLGHESISVAGEVAWQPVR